jgi:hypothetical protein
MVARSSGRQRSFHLSPVFISFSMDIAAAAVWTGIQNIPWHLALHDVALPGGLGTVHAALLPLVLIDALGALAVACAALVVGVFMVGGARAVRDYRRRKKSSTSPVTQTRGVRQTRVVRIVPKASGPR